MRDEAIDGRGVSLPLAFRNCGRLFLLGREADGVQLQGLLFPVGNSKLLG